MPITQPQLTALTTALAAASVSAQAAKVAAAALVDPAQKAAITAAQAACNTVVSNLAVASTAVAILKGAVVSVPTVVSWVVGTVVTASWTGSVSAKDWVGIYAAGTPGSAHLDWCYVNGTKTAGVVVPVGSAVLSGTVGHFELRLMQNDTYTVIATSAPFDVAAPVQQPPPVGTGMPVSADFVSRASDPRGGDVAYGGLARDPVTGDFIGYGGFSHDRSGNNAVVRHAIAANAWTTLKAHTPWVDTTDVSGRTFLGNRDNHNMLVINDVLFVGHGERGINLVGNWGGKFSLATKQWTLIDDDKTKLKFPWQENSACGQLDADTWYCFGGNTNNPTDALSFIKADGTVTTFWNQWGASFSGSIALPFVQSSHFVRQGKIYVYSVSTLWQIDPTNRAAPKMAAFATNQLAVQGLAIMVGYDATRDQATFTNGKAVNVFDFASIKFVDVPVNTPADPDRQSPSPAEAPRAAIQSPEAGGLFILGGHGRCYLLKLNYGGTVPVPPPVVIPPVVVPPVVVPPVVPPVVPTQNAGTLKLVTTSAPLTGPATVLGAGKHFDFAKLGNRWYRTAGDSASSAGDAITPSDLQDGNQQMLSVNIALNDWRKDTPYYMPASDGVQAANPDDAFSIVVNGEAWVMNTATTRAGALPQPSGAAQQVDLLQKVCAYSPPSAQWPRGHWRVVANRSWVINGDDAWRGFHDPTTNRVIIPTNRNGSVWCILDATTGADLTAYTNGIADQHGDFIFSVAGAAPDFAKRLFYVLDLNTMALYSVNMDNPGWPTKVCQLPERFPQTTQGAIKLCWHPDLRAVVVAADKLHAFEVDNGKLTSWARTDGFTNDAGKYVPTSTIFYDDEVKQIVSIGTMDWDTGQNPGKYWLHKITV